MNEIPKLTHPWLVAVWPGMGGVALSAGYYLLAKLGMHLIAEYEADELFDVDHVEVKDGILQAGRRPRNRLFLWSDPSGKHDIVLFLGEAQPPLGKYGFCRKLVEHARELGVERVFTFAAMATQMHPKDRSRVFAAATDAKNLEELKRLELTPLEGGDISGLNGVLLGVAAEGSLPGACLLGEMPHIFSQFPFPKASLAILEAFTTLAGVEIDFTELTGAAREVERQLGTVLAQINREPVPEEESDEPAIVEEERPAPAERQKIEALFREAAADRSKAFELKQELDRLGLFKDFEDRFLDLFKKV